MLVDLDEPGVQALDRECVLTAQQRIPPRLDPEELRQPVEHKAVQREVALERRQAAVDVSYACLEAVDARVDRVDLRHETLGSLLGVGDAPLQDRDLRVDGMLVAVDVARGGGGQKQGPDRGEGQAPHWLDVRGSASCSSTRAVRAGAARVPGADPGTAPASAAPKGRGSAPEPSPAASARKGPAWARERRASRRSRSTGPEAAPAGGARSRLLSLSSSRSPSRRSSGRARSSGSAPSRPPGPRHRTRPPRAPVRRLAETQRAPRSRGEAGTPHGG